MDYATEQALEIESLQAIFADQLRGKLRHSKMPIPNGHGTLASDTETFAEYEGSVPTGWQAPCYQIAITPSQDELSSSGSAACKLLHTIALLSLRYI